MKNFAHSLFLLMFNLSQMHNRDKIIELFIDGMNEAVPNAKFNYALEKQKKDALELKTRNSSFGFICIEFDEEKIPEDISLIQNAVQMLAVILERLVFDEKLQEEKTTLEKVADTRFAELQKTVAELQKARSASFNLIEDLTDEIQKRKQYEQELIASEERFRLVMENTLDAVLITNPDGSIISANPAACKMFQMTEQEIIDAGRNGIVDLNDPNLPALMEERQRTGKTKGELAFIRKDKSRFITEITSSVFETSEGSRTGIILRDITERKKFEKELKESEERFATAFRASPAPLVISEIDTGLFVDVNNQWETMLGYPKNELIGKTSKEVGIWADPLQRDRIVQKLLEYGSFREEYIEFKTKSGESILALWSAETIFYSNKKLMLSMIHDITARVKAEEELRRLKDNLQQEVDEKTRELHERIAELERFQNATIEREFRIKELRDEIARLKSGEN
jgi:PAS domain S-box-containing protein